VPPPTVSPEDVLLAPFTLQATIDPVSQGVGTITTPWFNAAGFLGVVALIQTGLLGVAATVDAKLQLARDGSGTGAKDAGKAITQIVKATGDNKQSIIRAPAWQLDFGSGFPYARLSITVGGAASLIAASVYSAGRQGEQFQPVAASVAEIV
jgi:hypothetical protein